MPIYVQCIHDVDVHCLICFDPDLHITCFKHGFSSSILTHGYHFAWYAQQSYAFSINYHVCIRNAMTTWCRYAHPILFGPWKVAAFLHSLSICRASYFSPKSLISQHCRLWWLSCESIHYGSSVGHPLIRGAPIVKSGKCMHLLGADRSQSILGGLETKKLAVKGEGDRIWDASLFPLMRSSWIDWACEDPMWGPHGMCVVSCPWIVSGGNVTMRITYPHIMSKVSRPFWIHACKNVIACQLFSHVFHGGNRGRLWCPNALVHHHSPDYFWWILAWESQDYLVAWSEIVPGLVI